MTSAFLIPLSSTLKSETGYDIMRTRPIEIVQELKTPVYIMVGEGDTISPPEKLKGLFEAYGSFHLER